MLKQKKKNRTKQNNINLKRKRKLLFVLIRQGQAFLRFVLLCCPFLSLSLSELFVPTPIPTFPLHYAAGDRTETPQPWKPSGEEPTATYKPQ